MLDIQRETPRVIGRCNIHSPIYCGSLDINHGGYERVIQMDGRTDVRTDGRTDVRGYSLRVRFMPGQDYQILCVESVFETYSAISRFWPIWPPIGGKKHC